MTKPKPNAPALAKLAWWNEFVKEIEALGGIVIGHGFGEEIDLKIPEDRIDTAKAIMKRYWDETAKCARAVCFAEPIATHTVTGLKYCIRCARKINEGARELGFVGDLVTWPKPERVSS